jgi:CHAT domain-containing protein
MKFPIFIYPTQNWCCETGLGDIQGSEGVYGLQRAFKIAGVEYIVMTLWQVLDKETSEFMTLFYQNLLSQKSIPDAFKSTQDTMKNKYREEPYKWAGFVLVN